MKINPSSIDGLVNGKDAHAGPDAASGKPPPTPPKAGGDRVDLSPLSAQIAALESRLSVEPAFDRTRVEAIKQAIVEGRLTVSAEIVADKMVASALALLERSSK